MVVCPDCHYESSGRFFCDRCGSLLPYTPLPALPSSVTLADGRTVDCSGWQGCWPADAWQPLTVATAGRVYRVYALNRGWWRELAAPIRERAALALDVLAPIEVIPVEDSALVFATALPGARRALAPTGRFPDELARLEDTLAACRTLACALTPLHQAGLVWLSFHPAALEVADGRVQITNLDLQLFRADTCPESPRLSGAYSPPEVCSLQAEEVGPATDVFHLCLYAYYRLAGLLPDGFPGHGLESFQFDIPPLRIYRPDLPAGIVPVLERGLDRDPAWRYPRVADLMAELEAAAERARARLRGAGGLRFEAGSATAIGRAHALEGLPNQDARAVLPLATDRLLAIVADGVTNARLGRGELASRTAVETLAGRLPGLLAATSNPDEALTHACVDACRAILEQSGSVVLPDDFDPTDLMSSTAVIGWFDGRLLRLASVGDSRAYLIAYGRAEQLTVDGDVRCFQLAAGVAPEEVRALGPDAQALFSCLGIGERGPAGRLVPCLARSVPSLSSWPLVPGDVVLLCSDGVVEEGIFVEPAELAGLAAEAAGLPAEELACRLVALACSRHRDPSLLEPTGCGDDATCIVVRVHAAPPDL